VGNILNQQEFSQVYSVIGDPGTVFGGEAPPIFASLTPKNVLSGSYDLANLSSYALQAFCKESFCYINEQVAITLVLSSSVNMPFFIDLTADLNMYVNGVLYAYTYQSTWDKNIAVIQFKAPATPGLLTINFNTAFSIRTNSALVNINVQPQLTNDLILTSSATQYSNSQDVTVVSMSAKSRTTGLPAKQFGRNVTLATTQLTNSIAPIEAGIQEFSLVGPTPPGGHTVPNAWFSFFIDANCTKFSGITADLSFFDVEGTCQWTMPLVLPEDGSRINLTLPFPNWDDSYTFLLSLIEDIGWQAGTFKLKWTHYSNQFPVTVTKFAVSAADPSYQPITFHNNDTDALIASVFPIVWVNGSTNLVLWADESV
jgi:hypothetical protein